MSSRRPLLRDKPEALALQHSLAADELLTCRSLSRCQSRGAGAAAPDRRYRYPVGKSLPVPNDSGGWLRHMKAGERAARARVNFLLTAVMSVLSSHAPSVRISSNEDMMRDVTTKRPSSPASLFPSLLFVLPATLRSRAAPDAALKVFAFNPQHPCSDPAATPSASR